MCEPTLWNPRRYCAAACQELFKRIPRKLPREMTKKRIGRPNEVGEDPKTQAVRLGKAHRETLDKIADLQELRGRPAAMRYLIEIFQEGLSEELDQ